MAEDFLKFDHDKLNLDDFSFNVSSAIPEHELLEFASFDTQNNGVDNVHLEANINNNVNNPNNENLSKTNDDHNPFQEEVNISLHSNENNGLNPSQILHQSYDSNYFSPAASPYNTNPAHVASYQPPTIQQSLSRSIQRGRQSSISDPIDLSRKNSLYDTLDSMSGQPTSVTGNRLNPAYFSPVSKSIPLATSNNINTNNSRNASIQMGSIASPSSFNNDVISPYSSFDPSFKSPRSIGASPIPSGSFNGPSSLPKQQLSKEEKLRRRREFHNQVERRRRDLIKEKIKELGLIIPPSLLYLDEEGKEVKASKNVIINKTVDYVIHLHKVMKEQASRREKLMAKIEELEAITGVVASSSQTPVSNDPTPPHLNEQQTSSQPPPQTSSVPQIPRSYPEAQHNVQDQWGQPSQNPNDSFDTSPFSYQADQGNSDSFDYHGNSNNNLPEMKMEDNPPVEFDVNEFLKEHNETWDHSNI